MCLCHPILIFHWESSEYFKRKQVYGAYCGGIICDLNLLHQTEIQCCNFLQAAKSKHNEDLALWGPSVRNHFWYCSKNCKNDSKTFKARQNLMTNSYDYAIVGITLYSDSVFILQDMWIGILHHVVNEHEWVLEEGNNGGECDHAPLNDDERSKPWLKKDSPPHKALTKIILDKRFLNTIPYYINFI